MNDLSRLSDNMSNIVGIFTSDFVVRPATLARKLNVSTRTVYRLIESEELEARKATKRNTRISIRSIDEYLIRLNED